MKLFSLILALTSMSAFAEIKVSKHELPGKALINSTYRGSNPAHTQNDPYLHVLSDGTGFVYRVKNFGELPETAKVFSQLSRVGDLDGCSKQYDFVYKNQQNGVVATELEREFRLQAGEENKDTGFLVAQGRFKPGIYEHMVCVNGQCSSKQVALVDSFACAGIADKELLALSRGMAFGVSPNYQNVACNEQPVMGVLPSSLPGKLVLYWNAPTRNIGSFPVGAYQIYKWRSNPDGSRGSSASLYAITQENFLVADEGHYDINFMDKAGTVHSIRSATFNAFYDGGAVKMVVAKRSSQFPTPPAYCLDPVYLAKNRKPTPGY